MMNVSTFYGTGRRKRSVARVYLTPGKGNILVNGVSFEKYLCRQTLATIVMQPLVAIDGAKSYDIRINVKGGGLTGQAGAIRLGISRALLSVNKDFRSTLKPRGFLTGMQERLKEKARDNLELVLIFNFLNVR